jgi:CRP/FNR family transcriptional regulator, nitrogen fixation regulation protein
MFAIYPDVTLDKISVPFGRVPVPTDTGIPRRLGMPGIGTEDLADDWLGPLVVHATPLHFDRDAEIIAQGARAEHCFQVISGCVRTVRLLEDGRRQVGEFLLAGDVFGWDAVGEYEFAAEAVTPVTLHRFRLSTIEDRADEDRRFAQRLRRYTADQVRLARNRLVLLGRKTAAERIACFLLEMSERLHCPGQAVIELPMSRADMADYLGLTIETVCRGLTELRRQGTIAVERTRLVIQDPRALALAGSDWLQ